MISIFWTKLKLCFQNDLDHKCMSNLCQNDFYVKMPSVIDIIIQIYIILPRHVFLVIFENFDFSMTKWLSNSFHTWKLYYELFYEKILNHFLMNGKLQKRQLNRKGSLNNFKVFFKFVWNFYDKHFSHRLHIWKRIFLLWTSTWACAEKKNIFYLSYHLQPFRF